MHERRDVRGLRVMGFCDWFDGGNGGGAERAAAETWSRLAAAGAEVLVEAVEPGGRRRTEHRGGLTVDRYPALDLTPVTGVQALLAPSTARGVRAAAERFRPHVLHAAALHFRSSGAAAVTARRFGAPLVLTAQIAGGRHLRTPARLALAAYERTAGRRILASCRSVVAVSPGVRDHLVRMGVPPARIDLVPNGVDVVRFGALQHRPQDPPLVLFVGRLVENKGPRAFIEALARLRTSGVRFHAALVGPGPLRRRLERRCARLGLRHDVAFTGHVPDVRPWLERATVLVRPSATEGLSLALLEAMAAGVPVIATDVPGNRDLVGSGAGLLVPPRDVRAHADAIAAVLLDGSLREHLAHAGRDLARRHDWARTAEGTAAVLLRAASTPLHRDD